MPRRLPAVAALLSILLCTPILSAGSEDIARASDREAKGGPKTLRAVILRAFQPTYFQDDKTGRATGLAVEILTQLAEREGLQVTFTFAESWAEMIEKVSSGDADVVPGLTPTEERKKILLFGGLIDTARLSIFIRSDDPSTGLRGGMKVGATRGSVSHEYVKTVQGIQVKVYEGYPTGILDLLTSRIDALAGNAEAIWYLAREAGLDHRIKTVGKPFGMARHAIAVRRDHAALLQRLTGALESFVTTPQYREIYLRWHEKPKPYWTPLRVVLAMAAWRYRSLRRLNQALVENLRERERIESALRESESRFKTLAEASFEGIALSDGGKLLDVNDQLAGMLGYDRGELLGTMVSEHVAPEYRETVKESQGRSLLEPYENAIVRKDGTKVHVETRARTMQIDGNEVRLTAIRDITERKRGEEEKQRLEERLNRAEKMEALGTLAGGVAHDLDNALGVLVGYSELLLMEIQQGNPLRRHASNILQSGQRAAAIIQDLLTLARRGVAVSEVVNLNDLISDHLKTPEFEKLKTYHSHVTFRTDLGRDLMNIKGSPVHLGKTVMNLLSNAAEAITDPGEVTILTENRYLDKPVTGYDHIQEGDYAVLQVSDNGRGISSQDIGKIFEPFYTKKVMGRSGTGLGLAVVWGTVKDHQGYIDVQSEEGEGSTFTLYFPVTREEKVSDRQVISPESYMGRGESILVVDDVKEQRDLATAMLSRLGYTVRSVSSGEEAVAYLKADKADLLVLDMVMDPGMDGLETYEKILEINPSQRAIIVSGFSETERVKKAQDLGAGAYVRKPYLQEKIGLAIRKELDKYR